MMSHTHQTVPTQCSEDSGIRFAYRRFGKPDGVPLVFNQHFSGTMDHWAPAVTDGLATKREVILFNNAGDRDALLLGHGNSRHLPMPEKYDGSTYKVFLAGARGTQIPAARRCHHPASIPGRTGP